MTSKSKAKPRLSGRMLPIMHPDAAGIDIGAEEIFVSVRPDRDVDCILYHMLSTRQPYSDEVFARCDQQASIRAEVRLRKQAAELGF